MDAPRDARTGRAPMKASNLEAAYVRTQRGSLQGDDRRRLNRRREHDDRAMRWHIPACLGQRRARRRAPAREPARSARAAVAGISHPAARSLS